MCPSALPGAPQPHASPRSSQSPTAGGYCCMDAGEAATHNATSGKRLSLSCVCLPMTRCRYHGRTERPVGTERQSAVRACILQVHKRITPFSDNEWTAADINQRFLPHVVPVHCCAQRQIGSEFVHHNPQTVACWYSHAKYRQPIDLPVIWTALEMRLELGVVTSCDQSEVRADSITEQRPVH